MYAVIRSGGKQYRVQPGETVTIERLPGKPGNKVTFDDVIAVRTDENKVVAGKGASNAKVTGKILKHERGPKLTVLKYKTGGQYKISRGHRQGLTSVAVNEIEM